MFKAIKRRLNQLYSIIKLLGLDPFVLKNTIPGLGFYFNDYLKIIRQRGKDTKFHFGHSFPILHERNSESGTMSGHYFHQDLLVARRIFLNHPIRHIDIGSRIDGFVAHVAVFRTIEIFDIRLQKSKVENIVFKQADLMNLPVDLINYSDSISSLHAIEHFGLGRYGDPIDYYGHEKAITNISQLLVPNGIFYFSVPIGKQRIEFNAHRIFSLKYLVELIKPLFIIERFSYVDDKGNLFENVKLTESKIESNFDCHFGCGIFELRRI